MRTVAVGVVFLIGCVAQQQTKEEEQEDLRSGKWYVVVSKEDFIKRYPGLPLEYMEKMVEIERTVKRGESLRESYFGTDPEERNRKRKILDQAVRTYVEALNKAETVYKETGCDAVMVFLSKTVGEALRRLLVEYERWRKIKIE